MALTLWPLAPWTPLDLGSVRESAGGSCVLPAESVVQSGEGYGADGTEFEGTLEAEVADYPPESKVISGTTYANGAMSGAYVELLERYSIEGQKWGYNGQKSGAFVVPIEGWVTLGNAYGFEGEFVGVYEPPDPDLVDSKYVLEGIVYAHNQMVGEYVPLDEKYAIEGAVWGYQGEKQGAFVVPAEADTKVGTIYGFDGEFIGTYLATADYPASRYVIKDILFADGTRVGAFVVPGEADTRYGVTYGYEQEYTGALIVPEAVVATGRHGVYDKDVVVWVQPPTRNQFGEITAEGERVNIRCRVTWRTKLVRNRNGEQVVSAAQIRMTQMPTHEDLFEISGVTHAVIAVNEQADFTVRHYEVFLS